MAYGDADSGAMKDLGKPGAGESHARFDEGRLETGSGLGQPSLRRVSRDSAGPSTTTAPVSYSTARRRRSVQVPSVRSFPWCTLHYRGRPPPAVFHLGSDDARPFRAAKLETAPRQCLVGPVQEEVPWMRSRCSAIRLPWPMN
jgi:hypothetical protein